MTKCLHKNNEIVSLLSERQVNSFKDAPATKPMLRNHSLTNPMQGFSRSNSWKIWFTFCFARNDTGFGCPELSSEHCFPIIYLVSRESTKSETVLLVTKAILPSMNECSTKIRFCTSLPNVEHGSSIQLIVGR